MMGGVALGPYVLFVFQKRRYFGKLNYPRSTLPYVKDMKNPIGVHSLKSFGTGLQRAQRQELLPPAFVELQAQPFEALEKHLAWFALDGSSDESHERE